MSSQGSAAFFSVGSVGLIGLALFGVGGYCIGKETPSPISIDASQVEAAERLGKAFAAISRQVTPAVVSVFSEKFVQAPQLDLFERPLGRKIPWIGMGSGMVLDHEGHILTNLHVVGDVDEIKVKFPNQRIVKARVIGADVKTDVVVLAVPEHAPDSVAPVRFGDSGAAQVGDLVLAVGTPFGLPQSVTHGIISAVGRSEVGIADFEDFIQTDAPINPGNSGGPLVNTRGEVIGMNTAIATNVGQSGGVGFAIPSNMIKELVPRLIRGERIIRGELGVETQNLDDELAREFKLRSETQGVLVAQVAPDSAAARAGIRTGDVITQYGDKPVADGATLKNLVAASAPGSEARIKLLRERDSLLLAVKLGQDGLKSVPASAIAKKDESTLNRLGLTVDRRAVVTEMAEGGPADSAGLEIGDMIVEANRKPVRSASDLRRAVARSKERNLLFLVKRQGSGLFVVLNR